MRTIKIDETKLLSAIIILENYLDGAVADLLDNSVENKEFVHDAIYVHKKLESAINPLSALVENEYEKMIREKENEKSS